jgi:glycine/D-amino acid oxidase-like deaminating enzyme
MPSATRYDVVVVGGGLAGAAVATLLAKRGRRVALVEPRPDWGGRYAARRVGGVPVPLGATLAMGYERLGAADAYFEAVGLSLSLLSRESPAMKREPVQTIWGPHRITMTANRPDFIEELRREYRVGEPGVEAMLTDLDAARRALAPLCDPSPSEAAKGAWAHLRHAAAARSFAARFGRLDPADYAEARGWPAPLSAYLDALRSVVASPVSDRDAGAEALYRLGLALQGLVTLPAGRSGLCRLLVARCEALGGRVVRAPITAAGGGRRPFVEAEGERLEGVALVVNARRPPGDDGASEAPGDVGATVTFAFTLPADRVPEAMGRFLLVSGDGERDGWALSRFRLDDGGQGTPRETVAVSCAGPMDARRRAREAERFAERLTKLAPFAGGAVTFLGAISDDEVPDPVEAKAWTGAAWRPRRWGWAQAGRSPVWWLADAGSPWLDDPAAYRTALAVEQHIRLV